MNKKTIASVIAVLVLLTARMTVYPQFIKQQPRPKKNIELLTQTLPQTHSYLDVQYICQAPLKTEANWEYHEESCEEVASLMAYLYTTNQTMTPQEAHETLLDMIDWQMDNFEVHRNIYDIEVKELIVEFFQIPEDKVAIMYDATPEQIKEQIDKGIPVIAPTTAKYLENPHYPHPGYHMLIIKGYTPTTFITNDNGTRHGEDYEYQIDRFMEAMQDAGGDPLIIEPF
jgi:hypothetical protein